MRIAQRVHQTAVKEPNKVTLDMQKVVFKPPGPSKPKVVYKTPEDAAEAAKRGPWAWLMGMARNCPPEYKEPVHQPIPSGAEVDQPHVVTAPVPSSQGPVRGDLRSEREEARERLRSMWDL